MSADAHDDDSDDGDERRGDEPAALAASTPLYAAACAAFCRGRLGLPGDTTDVDAIAAGRGAGLRLHRFKRARVLPRVHAILGALRGFTPAELLDIGTGRGVFLWPLLDAMPALRIHCVDVRADRVDDLGALARGGLALVSAEVGSVEALAVADRAFDVVTALEVLEHVADPAAAARELVRVGRRAILVTVPSQPDDNPEHLRLFDARSLEALFKDAGAARVSIDGVPGHLVAVVRLRA